MLTRWRSPERLGHRAASARSGPPLARSKRPQFQNRGRIHDIQRSEEHTAELQSLMRTSYAVFCLKQKKQEQYERGLSLPIVRKLRTARQVLNKYTSTALA